MQNGPTHVDAGLERLTGLLPLGPRVSGLEPALAAVHTAVLASYLRTGAAPGPDALARAVPDADVPTALDRLSALDLVVTDGGLVVGAYPFTSTDTPHRVESDGVESAAMCSLDALAIGAVGGAPTTVRSRCADTGRPIRVEMAGGAVRAADPPEPMVGIRWQEPGSCAAASLCPEMVFLADAVAARRWVEAVGDADRYRLDEAVTFAERFFRPVMAAAVSARAG